MTVAVRIWYSECWRVGVTSKEQEALVACGGDSSEWLRGDGRRVYGLYAPDTYCTLAHGWRRRGGRS
ncbi:MAG: hypothetical protein FWD79_04490 [Desulfobulbus sp.]|nr:hypothetical protein [Desulfobulbus sp.]